MRHPYEEEGLASKLPTLRRLYDLTTAFPGDNTPKGRLAIVFPDACYRSRLEFTPPSLPDRLANYTGD